MICFGVLLKSSALVVAAKISIFYNLLLNSELYKALVLNNVGLWGWCRRKTAIFSALLLHRMHEDE